METADKAEETLQPSEAQKSVERIVLVTASTDPNRALADIAQQREADRRHTVFKRGAQGLIALGVVVAALTIPRFRDPGRAAAPATQTTSLASEAKSPPAAVAAPGAGEGTAHEATTPALAPGPLDAPARCESQFKARQWRGAIESCGAAFDALPTAAVAMRVAHAHWAHGDAASAGTWARNALELESQDPDVYVLIGNAEHAAGKRRKAVAAYRRYLELAPRGWHAERLRSYVRPSSAGATSP